jgi:hypothetical protein
MSAEEFSQWWLDSGLATVGGILVLAFFVILAVVVSVYIFSRGI